MSRIFIFITIGIIAAIILGWSTCELAHAYELAQPTQLPPVEIVADKGPGVAYACNGPGWSTPWGDECPKGIYMSPNMGRRAYLHELGHHVDYLIPETDPFRYRFRELIGDPRPWRSSPNSPHEKFAEAYSICARHDPAKIGLWQLRWDFGYDYQPSVRKHRKVCRTIENAMARYPETFR